jgi:hypothetical protein
MTSIILQDDLESGEDQSRVAKLVSGSGEDLSGHESEFIEDLLG